MQSLGLLVGLLLLTVDYDTYSLLRMHCLIIAMIKLFDDSESINNCPCTVLVSCTLMYSFYTFFGETKYVAHNAHQLLFRTRFFVLPKFRMPNGSHVNAHRIYYLTVVHLFKCILS